MGAEPEHRKGQSQRDVGGRFGGGIQKRKLISQARIDAANCTRRASNACLSEAKTTERHQAGKCGHHGQQHSFAEAKFNAQNFRADQQACGEAQHVQEAQAGAFQRIAALRQSVA